MTLWSISGASSVPADSKEGMSLIEIIRCDTADRNIEEYHQRRIDRNNQILFAGLFSSEHWPYMRPYSIEIETVNRCNNDCSFCAVNRNHDTRPYHRMSEELLERILAQLGQWKYGGYLSLFSNNEPLLDNRIFSFLKKARQMVPDARLCLFTNGLLLTEEKFRMLTDTLDYLTIDNYSDDLELLPPVERCVRAFEEERFSCQVRVLIRKKTQVLSSRGGEAPNRQMDVSFEGPCMMPFMQIVIRPDGKVSQCCQDGLGHSCIGDLEQETLEECWENAARRELWQKLSRNGRGELSGCRHCDVFGHDNYMPDAWKPFLIQNLIRQTALRYLEGKKIFLAGEMKACRTVKRLLLENGIRTEGLYPDAESLPCREDAFYLLEKYEEPFLGRLDAKAVYAGEKWLVFERIPEYVIHDTSEQIFAFADLLGRLFENWNAPFYYWGDDSVLEYLEKYIGLPKLTRISGPKALEELGREERRQMFLLLSGAAEDSLEELVRRYGLEKKQILLYSRLLAFTDSL